LTLLLTALVQFDDKKGLEFSKPLGRKHFPALTACLPKVTHFLHHDEIVPDGEGYMTVRKFV
jgi:hypothetical protein